MKFLNFAVLIPLLFAPAVDARNVASKKQEAKKEAKHSLKHLRCTYKGINRQLASVEYLSDVEFSNPDQVVCDPLSGNASPRPENGLLGTLRVRSAEMGTKVNSVMDYYNKGTVVPGELYFADVNVPTRAFTEGFTNASGSILVDAAGSKLIEHFSIEYTTVLKLTASDLEGKYDLALISDDGARLFIKENGKWNELINNDGTHPTKMACANRMIDMKRDTALEVKVLYYQGPRYHIANSLIWRHESKIKKSARGFERFNTAMSKLYCGKQGNFFFAKGKNKTELSPVMVNQGFSVVPAANFFMPDYMTNPCVKPDLAIADFKVESAQAPNARITWKTNVPAKSQLRVVNIYTGEEILLQMSDSFVTDHIADLSNLVRGIYYQVQAISVDERGQVVRTQFIDLLP